MDDTPDWKEMKIAFIGQKGIPATFGGVEYHVDRLSTELAALGHDVTVYVRNWYTEKGMNTYKGVRLVHIPTIRSKHADASIHSFFCSVHSLFVDYDIIHYHGIGPAFFSLIPRAFRKNVVTTIHRLDWDTEKWGKPAKILLKMGEKIAAKVPLRTLVVSKDLQKYVRDTYNAETIHIPHGIDPSKPRAPQIITEKYGLEGRDFVLFMGRLTPEKRVDWLIDAFQDVLEQLPPQDRGIKLIIAGGSSATPGYVRKLQEMSRNEQRIVFIGYVTGEEKEELLSNALIFSLPSHLEGYPIVLLEARSYGLCCLTSDIPPHADAIRDETDGVLFKTDDPFDLRKKLLHLIRHPELALKLGLAARQDLHQKQSWSEIAAATAAIYRELCI
ncbi:MAG: glycosyltransferase family 4 protein [Candidatus Aminicenantes bacterium]|nr:glycosyltransferase family 4 protein [Candidatus Aminicenantes bacterium]